jgi:cytochrome b561
MPSGSLSEMRGRYGKVYVKNFSTRSLLIESLFEEGSVNLLKIKRDNKNLINYFLDIILALSVISTLASSYILWFVLPRGQGAHFAMCAQQGQGFTGNYYDVFGLPRYVWIDIHNWASVILLGIIILHIVMHWNWVIETLKRAKSYFNGPVRKAGEQFIASITLFVLFIADCFSGFVVWLILPRGALDYYNMLSGAGRTFWGLQRNTWVDIHVWLATLILAVVIIHIVLNWRWIANVSKKLTNGIAGLFERNGNTEAKL